MFFEAKLSEVFESRLPVLIVDMLSMYEVQYVGMNGRFSGFENHRHCYVSLVTKHDLRFSVLM